MAVSVYVIAAFFTFWASIYLTDIFLRSNCSLYSKLLEKSGISIYIFQIRWYTTTLNEIFVKVSVHCNNMWKIWFSIGSGFGVVSMFASVILLVYTLCVTLQPETSDASESYPVLTPVLPGVNLPSEQIIYYLLTLLVCGILHEVGHAVAASSERVVINGYGIFLFLIYPGAFVDLQNERLQSISPIRQLRIYCAGVWHNGVLVVLAMLTLVALPTLLSPFYTSGDGVIVTKISHNSPLKGAGGLGVGRLIKAVAACRVTSTRHWRTCLSHSITSQNIGYCISPEDQISPVDCCAQNTTSSSNLCFEYNEKHQQQASYRCLPARPVSKQPFCSSISDCYSYGRNMVCAKPAIENSTKFLRISTDFESVLFLGDPLHLYYTVDVADHTPLFSFLPYNLPFVLDTLCKYVVSLSGALAILNVVPCYALDGQFILRTVIDMTLNWCKPAVKQLVFSITIVLGSVLLAANIFLAFKSLLLSIVKL